MRMTCQWSKSIWPLKESTFRRHQNIELPKAFQFSHICLPSCVTNHRTAASQIAGKWWGSLGWMEDRHAVGAATRMGWVGDSAGLDAYSSNMREHTQLVNATNSNPYTSQQFRQPCCHDLYVFLGGWPNPLQYLSTRRHYHNSDNVNAINSHCHYTLKSHSNKNINNNSCNKQTPPQTTNICMCTKICIRNWVQHRLHQQQQQQQKHQLQTSETTTMIP